MKMVLLRGVYSFLAGGGRVSTSTDTFSPAKCPCTPPFPGIHGTPKCILSHKFGATCKCLAGGTFPHGKTEHAQPEAIV